MTETITQLDTIIKVVHDTVSIVKMGTIHDTIKIENTASRVIAYFDVGSQKFVVKLEGKPFYVPMKINQRVMTLTRVNYVEKKNNWLLFYVLGALTVIVLIIIKKRWL